MRALIPAMLMVAGLLTQSAAAQDRVSWLGDLSQAQQIAAQRGQLVLVHFWGENCGPCIRLEHYVFNRPEVIRSINSGFVAVKVNVNERPDVADRFRITSMPVDVVLTPDGRELHRAVSPQNPNQYVASLDQVAALYRSGYQVGIVSTTNSAPQVLPSSGALPPTQAGLAPPAGAAFGQPGQSFANPQFGNSPAGNPQFGQPAAPASTAPGGMGFAAAQPARGSDFQPAASNNSFAANGTANTAPWASDRGNSPPATSFANSQLGAGRAAAAPQSVNNQFIQEPASGLAASAVEAPGGRAQGTFDATRQTPDFAAGSHGPVAAVGTTGAPEAAQPASFNLPPGSPPVMMEGCCPVTLVEQSNWLPGSPQFGAVHRGRTYLFQGAVEQQQFLASPDRYSPVLSGFDPVRFVELGQSVEGKREFGVSFEEKIYLFADADARDRFESNPYHYSQAAHEVMRQSDAATRQPGTR